MLDADPYEFKKHVLAGFWRRFFASFIDGLLLGGVSGAIGFVVGIFLGVNPSMNTITNPDELQSLLRMQSTISCVLSSVGIILSWLYFAGFESSHYQGTPGKMIMGVIVTDVNGNRIGFGRATARYFGKLISASILYIGYIMAAFTQKKQALHDMIAGTLVIHES